MPRRDEPLAANREPAPLAPAEVRFPCPSCGGDAVASTRRKFWADVDGIRTYVATCERCRTVTVRHPLAYVNAVCVSCAGTLTWATRWDTAADTTRFPLICAHCAKLADGGMQFRTDAQSRLALRIYAIDAAADREWLRYGGYPPERAQTRAMARIAPRPTLADRRNRLHAKLADATRRTSAGIVHAADLPKPSLFG